MTSTYVKRFEAKFSPEPNIGCWLWTAAVSGPGIAAGKGYGAFSWPGGTRATHFALKHYRGMDVPRGMGALHRCDQPSCVNPSHLFVGDQRANMRDCAAKGRCSNGAPELRRGENGSKAKLKEAEAQFILDHPEIPGAVLARRFGINDGAVWFIRHRRNWKHLSPTTHQ